MRWKNFRTSLGRLHSIFLVFGTGAESVMQVLRLSVKGKSGFLHGPGTYQPHPPPGHSRVGLTLATSSLRCRLGKARRPTNFDDRPNPSTRPTKTSIHFLISQIRYIRPDRDAKSVIQDGGSSLQRQQRVRLGLQIRDGSFMRVSYGD